MAAKNYTPIDDLIKKSPFIPPFGGTTVGISKEAEPSPVKSEEIEIKEAIEQEEIDEVKPYLKKRAETIKLPPDLQKLGLQPASTTQFPNYQTVKLPISDDKIIVGLHAPLTSSLRWLATLALYILQQTHLVLKVVHGKVVRVLKRY